MSDELPPHAADVAEFAAACRELVVTLRADRATERAHRRWIPIIMGLYGSLLTIVVIAVVLNTQARLAGQLTPPTPREIASEVVKAISINQNQHINIERSRTRDDNVHDVMFPNKGQAE